MVHLPEHCRCELITVAERHHYDIDQEQLWRLSWSMWYRTYGWKQLSRYATPKQAKRWCLEHGIPMPELPPASTTAAPAQPQTPYRSITHDARALAAGEDS